MPITIVKKQWYEHQIERLKRASKTSERPVIIVSIDDEGYTIATTTQYCVEDKMSIRTRLPGKLEADKRSAAVNEYFREATNSLRQVWMKIRSPIVVIGVGFMKNDFVRFIKREANDIARSILDVKSVNNGGIAGIYEALRSGLLLKTMRQLRIVEETDVVEEILKRLGKSQRNVTYGLREVERATELGAVERIVVADTMIRESDEEKRHIIEQIMKAVEHKGGAIMVVSSQHEAGTKLLGLGGIAALLRFPIY
jgi:protein pelota